MKGGCYFASLIVVSSFFNIVLECFFLLRLNKCIMRLRFDGNHWILLLRGQEFVWPIFLLKF